MVLQKSVCGCQLLFACPPSLKKQNTLFPLVIMISERVSAETRCQAEWIVLNFQ